MSAPETIASKIRDKRSSCRSRLAAGGETTVDVWDVATRRCVAKLDLGVPVLSIGVMSAGFLAVGTQEGTVLWEWAAERVSYLERPAAGFLLKSSISVVLSTKKIKCLSHKLIFIA